MLVASPLLLALVSATLPSTDEELPPIVHGTHYPALSPDARSVVFCYRGDLFVAGVDEGVGRQLTIHDAYDCRPCWSPDGQFVAFSSDRYGNYDVFAIPAAGGDVARLTYHSADDFVRDFSPDGTKLLISSRRDTRFTAPYTLDLDSGVMRLVMEDVAPITPDCFAPDGRGFLGSRNGVDWWRVGYKGSTNADVYRYDADADTLAQLTDDEGTDRWSMVSPDGGTVYFVSERAGPPNLFALRLGSGEVQPVTSLPRDGVTWPKLSEDGSAIVFEHDNDVWLATTDGAEPRRLVLRVPTDDRTNPLALREATSGVDELEVAPDGTLVAVHVEGDILLLKPEFENDCIRLTDDPGDDSDFMWSPDSSRLVFTSTRTGNSDLFIADVATREIVQLTNTPEYEHSPWFSKDGKQVLFTRFWGDGIYSVPVEGGAIEALSFDRWGLVSDVRASPCGQWLLFTEHDSHGNGDIYVMPAAGGDPTNITRHPGWDGDARWDPRGEFVYFISDRDGQNDVYSVRLMRPPPEFTDYKGQDERKARKEGPPPAPEPAPKEGGEAAAPEKPATETSIDFTDIHLRARRLTSTPENEGDLTVTPDGKSLIYTLGRGRGQVWRMDREGDDAKQLAQGDVSAASLRLTEKGDRLFYRASGRAYSAPADGGQASEVKFRFAFTDDRRARQIAAFEQGWSLLNEAFYDPAFHGVDWAAAKARYTSIIDGTLVPEDFNQAMCRLCGELNASHLGCWGGGRGGPVTGELGLRFDPDYAGPGVRVTEVLEHGPCTDAGSEVHVGEYVLRMDDVEATNREAWCERLLGEAGHRVKLAVAAAPDATEVRDVYVSPVDPGRWYDIRYDNWVRECRERVRERSGGKLYYIHIRGMDHESLETFQRELHSEAKGYEGVVLDVRYNGGGNLHDELFAELEKRIHATKSLRHGVTVTQPLDGFSRPVVLLINEHSFSDAEAFPSSFRALGLGKLVGTRTSGGVIWTYTRTLVNGHGFRLPAWEWRTKDGADLENVGVAPDIAVPYPYEAFRHGRDPQLEAAVDELLREIGAEANAAP